ncbi:vascular-related unknown protein 4 isoform X2 [Dendrobium catenatum]|uniref:vascular-related unknown protein 4 isoform X2 n=1 Tax=Dendrobium catenatum TaxID=906689 RepID=UPI0010A06440|nr:vascular-related unknown protein 4 isoform X2 [Dendrobium catenatum]
MEESTESSINRDLKFSINSSSSSSLESGWTVYFEEFLASQKEEQKEQNTSSMVSDAASNFPAKVTVKSEPSVSCKTISLKKRKAKGVSFFDGDPLEDTASSPANSPTVSGMDDKLEVNKGKKDDIRSISEVKDCENCAEMKREVFDDLGVADGSRELTELKKKGLCLVPLSMLVDFLQQ